MADAKRDSNYVPTLMGVDYSDLTTPELIGVDPATSRMLVSAVVTSSVTGSVYKKLIDATTTANVTYIGEADLGTATTTAAWRIQKIDETSGVEITWSGTGFSVKWSERATVVTYS